MRGHVCGTHESNTLTTCEVEEFDLSSYVSHADGINDVFVVPSVNGAFTFVIAELLSGENKVTVAKHGLLINFVSAEEIVINCHFLGLALDKETIVVVVFFACILPAEALDVAAIAVRERNHNTD